MILLGVVGWTPQEYYRASLFDVLYAIMGQEAKERSAALSVYRAARITSFYMVTMWSSKDSKIKRPRDLFALPGDEVSEKFRAAQRRKLLEDRKKYAHIFHMLRTQEGLAPARPVDMIGNDSLKKIKDAAKVWNKRHGRS